jgi:protoporphyrinogen oxidase
MADWVAAQFGPTLCRLFFGPFHARYTAGLWTEIRPQDNYKTPIDKALVSKGSVEKTPDAGYNAEFVYPKEGLDGLARKMAARCEVRYGRRAVRIDAAERCIHFDSGPPQRFDRMISTLPLNRMVEMTGIEVGERADPHTSVLVLNVGARRGPDCPDAHWIYVPESSAGFHRVGFYSNVDAGFLPEYARDRVSLYIERAFLPGDRPSAEAVAEYQKATIEELQAWGFIGEVDVIDPTWIDVAYTWSWPDSTWREEAIQRLGEYGITMLGRYGRWRFQGIAASLREGLEVVDQLGIPNAAP